MKNICAFIAFSFLYILLQSCKEKKIEHEETITEEPAPKSTGDCYMSVSGKDSVLMYIVIENKAVTGHLHYRFFEKDKSGGDFFGNMRGDTLVADYKFISEGMESEREVAFLRKDDTFIEGYGEPVEKDGRVVFVDISSLQFTGMPLIKTNCEELTWYFHQ